MNTFDESVGAVLEDPLVEAALETIDEDVNIGVLEQFIKDIPEKAFHIGIRILLVMIALIIGMQIIKIIRKIVRKALDKAGAETGAVRFVDSLVKVSLYFLLVVMIASQLGVDAASIVAILGSAGVAIGLALQGSLSNLAGGVLLLVLKPFRIGDYIKDSSANEGTVSSIDLFYTELTTLDNKVISLPNGALANADITNYTKREMRRIDINVSISYDTDIRYAKEVLVSVLKEEPSLIETMEHTVFVDQLGESAVIMGIRCWVKSKDYWNSKWKITEDIKYALDKAGIKIPYPQLDVHNI